MTKLTMKYYLTIASLSIVLLLATAYFGYVLSQEEQDKSVYFIVPDIIHPLEMRNINHNQTESLNHQENISRENEVAKQISEIIDHFKKDDPVGLPLPIPDPMEIPGISQQNLGANLTFNPIFIHETSKFRILGATIEFDKQIVGSCNVSFDQIVLRGNYSLKHFIGRREGPFTITLKNLNVVGFAKLAVEADGKLRAQDIESDMRVTNMSVNLENLGILKEILGSFVNTKDDSFFKWIKPYIIKDSKKMIKKVIDGKIDENLSEYKLLPNSIGAIDFAVAEARKFVRIKFDPFKLEEMEHSGVFGYKLYDTELFGVSSFYRVGDLRTVIEDKKAKMQFEVGTQEIHGKTTWEVSVAKGMISRSGRVQFSIQYIKLNIELSQPIDLSKRLKFDDLQIDFGNIQILSSGMGTFDYVAEFLLNTIPNILRQQIMEVIRKPIIQRVQQYANRIDAEALIKDKVNEYFTTGTVSFDSVLKNEL